jgi:hypothetical protein
MKKIRIIESAPIKIIDLILDGGYSALKYNIISNELNHTGKIINAISSVPDGDAITDDEMDNIVEFEGKEYCIGEEALLLNPYATRSNDYWKKFYPIIIKYILQKHGFTDFKKIRVNLSIGLNLAEYEEKCDLILERINLLSPPNMDIFEMVIVSVQGQGIQYDMNVSGSLVVIIDVGYYNTTKLVFADGKLIKGKTEFNNEGTHILVGYIRKYIQHLYKIAVRDITINKILQTKKFFFKGDEIDLSDVINGYVEEYVAYSRSTFESFGIEDLKTADKIVLAGGGAYYLKDTFTEQFPQTVSPKNPEFSNLRGYNIILQNSKE